MAAPGRPAPLARDLDRHALARGPHRAESLRAQVTRELKAAIVSGRLEPGTMYSAPALATLFDVSPTPVREAMIDLVKDGLVESVRNKGFRIVEPSASELHDILELRLLIEVPVVRRLAERGMREAEAAALLPLAHETVRAANDADVIAHVAADLQFHTELVALWGNEEITEAVRTLRGRSRLAGLWSLSNREHMISSSHEHLELVRLIKERRHEEAADLMRTHVSRVGSLWDASARLTGG